MHRTFTSGEGWLIPGEILHHAALGVHSFVILQPFGCLPNHICGRGVVKRLKEEHPNIQVLPLDYDPDTSFANIENRLQMLIMNARELDRLGAGKAEEIPASDMAGAADLSRDTARDTTPRLSRDTARESTPAEAATPGAAGDEAERTDRLPAHTGGS